MESLRLPRLQSSWRTTEEQLVVSWEPAYGLLVGDTAMMPP